MGNPSVSHQEQLVSEWLTPASGKLVQSSFKTITKTPTAITICLTFDFLMWRSRRALKLVEISILVFQSCPQLTRRLGYEFRGCRAACW